MLQFVRGMLDPAIQEWVVQEAASVESGELSLSTVVKLVEAAEMGKSSQASISKAGQISRLSDHWKGKEQGKQEKRRFGQPEVKKSCGFCRRKDHGSGFQERRNASCSCFLVKCHECHAMGHLPSTARRARAGPGSSQRAGPRWQWWRRRRRSLLVLWGPCQWNHRRRGAFLPVGSIWSGWSDY